MATTPANKSTVSISCSGADNIQKMDKILKESNLNYTENKNNDTVVYAVEVNDEELSNLESIISREQFKENVAALGNGILNGAIGGISFVGKNILAPSVKVGAKVGSSAARIVAETGVKSIVGTFNAVAEQTAVAYQNIKADAEVAQAKNTITCAFKKVGGILGFKPSGNGISMTK